MILHICYISFLLWKITISDQFPVYEILKILFPVFLYIMKRRRIKFEFWAFWQKLPAFRVTVKTNSETITARAFNRDFSLKDPGSWITHENRKSTGTCSVQLTRQKFIKNVRFSNIFILKMSRIYPQFWKMRNSDIFEISLNQILIFSMSSFPYWGKNWSGIIPPGSVN